MSEPWERYYVGKREPRKVPVLRREKCSSVILTRDLKKKLSQLDIRFKKAKVGERITICRG